MSWYVLYWILQIILGLLGLLSLWVVAGDK